MKVLMVSTGADGGFCVRGGADSALLRPGEPIFVSEPTESWTLEVAVAVRISRLGLHIPERHAGRHYDAYGAIGLQLPLVDDGIPPLFHDRAMSPGKWIEFGEGKAELELEASLRPLPGRAAAEVCMKSPATLTMQQIDAAVAHLSRTMTLKTGDIIIFADTSTPLGHPIPDTHLSATVSGEESLSVRIK